MNRSQNISRHLLLGCALGALFATPAFSQDTGSKATAPEADAEAQQPEITVVGTRIAGAKVTEALPVVVLGKDKLDSVAAVSGDELIRSIPQMGDVSFNPNNSAQTSNAARGDVGSINLRSLGVGNTLVLLNGRRVVTHPSSQALTDTGITPVLTFNSNAIPTTGLERMEVLLDGAAALYGTDAIAGVVNTVLKTNYEGARFNTQIGGAEGTSMREFQANAQIGKNFKRGNITAMFEYTNRTALRAEDQDFTATADLRSLFANDPLFGGLTGSDTRNTRGVWAALQTNGIQVRQLTGVGSATRTLTTTAGAFHIRPAQIDGVAQTCSVTLTPGICLTNTTLPTTGTFRALRYDTGRNVYVQPEVKRYNGFATGHYDLTDDLTLFGEFGYYHSDTFRLQPAVINLNQIWIPASNYWNPFGATTLPNGQANPNRLAGLTNVAAAGIPVLMTNYRFADAGPQTVNVTGDQFRALVGLKGEALGFKWDSAVVYSKSWANDSSYAVKSSALQRQLALSTPDAYNPFSGGCVDNTSFGDCSPSSQAAIDAIGFTLVRKSKTTLLMSDFRASRSDLFSLPAGDVGVAFGIEGRRETQFDDRDASVDGSAPFVDAVTGEITLSDAAAVSPNPDTKGARNVAAGYVELAVPVINADMNIPLVRNLDLQLAGRAENYSDFGSIARPKVAVAWDVFDGFRLRGSYSEGFRAPNLEQTNAQVYSRNTTGRDYYRCEADLRAGRISSFANCGQTLNFSRRVAGNPDLNPEQSQNITFGGVFEPKFLPDAVGKFTFTVDYWRIKQTGLIGIFGGGSGNEAALALDYLNRLNGSSNSNVLRKAVNADDIAFFAGTGMTPAGTVSSIDYRFVNLLPQTVEGIDFAAYWSLRTDNFGKFDLDVNASYLKKYSRSAGPEVDTLIAAREAGRINAATVLPTPSDLIEQDGRPKWRGLASLTWSLGKFQIGSSARYIGKVFETGFVDTTGKPWVVNDTLTFNLYAQIKLKDRNGLGGEMRWRIGARNLTDVKPPLTSEGYMGVLYNPYSRYWYTSATVEF